MFARTDESGTTRNKATNIAATRMAKLPSVFRYNKLVISRRLLTQVKLSHSTRPAESWLLQLRAVARPALYVWEVRLCDGLTRDLLNRSQCLDDVEARGSDRWQESTDQTHQQRKAKRDGNDRR